MDKEQYQKLKDYALKLLSFRPRSISELRLKLKFFSQKKGISPDLTDKLIEELGSLKLVNDKEFVRWWTEQRRTFNPKGARVIKMELLQKGISGELIDELLDVPEKNLDDFKLAMQVVGKKILQFKNLEKRAQKKKISDLLLRKGFSWEIIYRVIDSVFKKSYNN